MTSWKPPSLWEELHASRAPTLAPRCRSQRPTLTAFRDLFSAFFHRHGPLSAREERPIGGGPCVDDLTIAHGFAEAPGNPNCGF